MLQRHRRSPRNQTLNRVYPEWIENKGVISSLTNAPWVNEVSQNGLDLAYHGARSGGKFISPVLYNFLDEDGEITQAGYTSIATMLMAKYGSKWTHLWELYSAEYNPLHSYAMTETEARDSEREISGRDEDQHRNLVEYDIDETESTSTDSTRTPNLTDTLTLNTEEAQENSITRTPALEEEKVSESTSVKTPATTETLTLNTTTTEDNATIRTPATSELTTKSESSTKTPNLTERTVLDEEVATTTTDDSETTYGKIVESTTESEDNALASKWGFNSSDAVPATSEHVTREATDTETQSGSDLVERDVTESVDRDSTSTTTTTGTEGIIASSTITVATSGLDTTNEDKTESRRGTETRAMTGTDTDEKEETVTITTTGTDTTEETKSLSNTGTETTVSTGTERVIGTEGTTKTGDNTVTTTESDIVTRTNDDTYHEEVERTKSGNLFKAPAELLSIDRDFWLMDFFEIVFMDIDAMLTLSIYSEAEINKYFY